MRYLYLILFFSFIGLMSFIEKKHPVIQKGIYFEKQRNKVLTDSSNDPPKNIILDLDSPKVIISNGDNQIEFTPHSSLNNGLLIQPVNRTNDTGIPTAFYNGDTTSWSFYTNSMPRMIIGGDGIINTSSTLLINNADNDRSSALRVNGNARVDTSIILQAGSDSNSFITLNRSIKSSSFDPDDKISPYASTPIGWAAGQNIPVFRIRHPNTVAGRTDINTSLQRDFMIYPYQYGIAIEYNGVVECWVGEWSIHKGLHYNDVEGKANGWGGVLWIGDDQDFGGVRATARNNIPAGGDVNYGELSVEKFAGAPNGDFRFRLPSTDNQFHFVYGGRGSTNIVAKVSDKGFFLPNTSADSIATPEKGQIFFDSAQSKFKGYDGVGWKDLADDIITGHTDSSANGTDSVYKIAHGLSVKPSYFNVLATSIDAANISYATADDTYIYIYYTVPPAAGTDNLSWNWQIKR